MSDEQKKDRPEIRRKENEFNDLTFELVFKKTDFPSSHLKKR